MLLFRRGRAGVRDRTDVAGVARAVSVHPTSDGIFPSELQERKRRGSVGAELQRRLFSQRCVCRRRSRAASACAGPVGWSRHGSCETLSPSKAAKPPAGNRRIACRSASRPNRRALFPLQSTLSHVRRADRLGEGVDKTKKTPPKLEYLHKWLAKRTDDNDGRPRNACSEQPVAMAPDQPLPRAHRNLQDPP